MSNTSLFNYAKNLIAKHYGKNPGKMLVHTGVIGWILSSAAQVSAIIFNDKIPKEQKMYLIPQEIADAMVNIVSFYAITQTFTSTALKLVNSGRWLPKSVKDFLVHKGVGDKLGKKGYDIVKAGVLSPAATKRFDMFKNGIDVIATTLGSILSCNIVTPLIRNEIAARRQKNSIEKLANNVSPVKTVDANTELLKNIQKPSLQSFQAGVYSKAPYRNSSSLKV